MSLRLKSSARILCWFKLEARLAEDNFFVGESAVLVVNFIIASCRLVLRGRGLSHALGTNIVRTPRHLFLPTRCEVLCLNLKEKFIFSASWVSRPFPKPSVNLKFGVSLLKSSCPSPFQKSLSLAWCVHTGIILLA